MNSAIARPLDSLLVMLKVIVDDVILILNILNDPGITSTIVLVMGTPPPGGSV
jgi:hypothetical protein